VGQLLVGLVRAPTKGDVASPLDDGAFTLVGSARADEGAGNGAMVSPFARSPPLLVALRERKGKEKNELRVWGTAGRGGFDLSMTTAGHRIWMNGCHSLD